MTARQARTERRAAERKARKAEQKRNRAMEDAMLPANVPAIGVVPQNAERSSRAEINRANAQRSTGPCTPEGKLASSRNSLKHGLASGEVIIAGEDPAAFEAVLRDLLEEHQPANPTQELLINEMAQSYWLEQRAIHLQNECFTEHGLDEKRLALFLRYQTTHHRAFHKALATLLQLRRGEARLAHFVSQRRAESGTRAGFVSQSDRHPLLSEQFVRQNAPLEHQETIRPLLQAA